MTCLLRGPVAAAPPAPPVHVATRLLLGLLSSAAAAASPPPLSAGAALSDASAPSVVGVALSTASTFLLYAGAALPDASASRCSVGVAPTSASTTGSAPAGVLSLCATSRCPCSALPPSPQFGRPVHSSAQSSAQRCTVLGSASQSSAWSSALAPCLQLCSVSARCLSSGCSVFSSAQPPSLHLWHPVCSLHTQLSALLSRPVISSALMPFLRLPSRASAPSTTSNSAATWCSP